MGISAAIQSFRYKKDLKKLISATFSINLLQEKHKKLTDDELTAAALQLRAQSALLADTDTVHMAFALAKEAINRTLKLTLYDEQIMAGLVLWSGSVADMKTGEGKTFVAPLAAYAKVIEQGQVHVVTVNDYLSKRDASYLRQAYEMLGLKVSFIQAGSSGDERKLAYQADVVYGTSSQFAFDYLRSNMAHHSADVIQKERGFAIVDEADSVLIDEARTPLIISGSTDIGFGMHAFFNKQAQNFSVECLENDDQKPSDDNADAVLNSSNKHIYLTEKGFEKLESILSNDKSIASNKHLYSQESSHLVHYLTRALLALHAFKKDVDYVVADDEVIIVDTNTGRLMHGRRWNDGLHQAIEVKESVSVRPENKTLATITLQNFFKLYKGVSGMTGTAMDAASEFAESYNMGVMVIPTHNASVRIDAPDMLFATKEQKLEAILCDVREKQEAGRPVLIGTASVAESEIISSALKAQGVFHNVLNAKNHELESAIVEQAGRSGQVTIATNMAGRGTDIILGGHPNATDTIADLQASGDKIRQAGGLHVIGTERHQSRRIDDQLRGRAGRQGDPGSSVFYLSLDDELLQQMGGQKLRDLFKTLGIKEDEGVRHRFIDRIIRNAQLKIESSHSELRKTLVRFDDIIDIHRSHYHGVRNQVLHADFTELENIVAGMIARDLQCAVESCINPEAPIELWNLEPLRSDLLSRWGIDAPIEKWMEDAEEYSAEMLKETLQQKVLTAFSEMTIAIGPEPSEISIREICFAFMDAAWVDHLQSLTRLKDGIGLRSYAGQDPFREYGVESYRCFEHFILDIDARVAPALFTWAHKSKLALSQASV